MQFKLFTSVNIYTGNWSPASVNDMQRMVCSNHSNYTICQDIRLVVATLDKHSKFQYAIQCPAHPHDSHVALWHPTLYQCNIDGRTFI